MNISNDMNGMYVTIIAKNITTAELITLVGPLTQVIIKLTLVVDIIVKAAAGFVVTAALLLLNNLIITTVIIIRIIYVCFPFRYVIFH